MLRETYFVCFLRFCVFLSFCWRFGCAWDPRERVRRREPPLCLLQDDAHGFAVCSSSGTFASTGTQLAQLASQKRGNSVHSIVRVRPCPSRKYYSFRRQATAACSIPASFILSRLGSGRFANTLLYNRRDCRPFDRSSEGGAGMLDAGFQSPSVCRGACFHRSLSTPHPTAASLCGTCSHAPAKRGQRRGYSWSIPIRIGCPAFG